MPSKNAGRHEKLKEQIQSIYNADWPRYMDRYNELIEQMDDFPSKQFDIDSALARKCTRDIREDGTDFMSEPDGIGGRVNLWLDELLEA